QRRGRLPEGRDARGRARPRQDPARRDLRGLDRDLHPGSALRGLRPDQRDRGRYPCPGVRGRHHRLDVGGQRRRAGDRGRRQGLRDPAVHPRLRRDRPQRLPGTRPRRPDEHDRRPVRPARPCDRGGGGREGPRRLRRADLLHRHRAGFGGLHDHPQRPAGRRVRRGVHHRRRRPVGRGDDDRAVLPRHRRGHLQRAVRRVRRGAGDHRAVAAGPGVAERWLLGAAAIAVAFAAADTYVVVLALPDMMRGAGLSIDELQRAAPIVSGFLLGYVAMLPLIGRIADLRGRLPVLVASLVIFAFGSLVTAAAYDLPSMVVGRFFQGVGGGGLVPATLALVADLYPPHRRGVPLGVVGAVQEIGSVLGPLLGAAVLAVADWQAIFWLNLAVGLVLAAALVAGRRRTPGRVRRGTDPVGLALLGIALVLLWLVMAQPPSLTREVTLGLPFVPFTGDNRWWSPLGVALAVAAVGL